ncbi:MAG: hypothetical protein ACHQ50_09005 [Fimbriimonadales bacterium]
MLRTAGLLAVALVSAGCARFPAIGATQNTHLIFTMTVAGHIRDGTQAGEPTPYIYMVAVNPSTDLFPAVVGPEPVVSAPWGNGFVAGNATHFIQYNAPIATYEVHKFLTADLLQNGITGAPVSSSTTVNTIQFEIDLSQILPPGVTDPATLQSVQVNFLTMDKIPTGSYAGQKFWDALGDGRDPSSVNDYVRIPLTSSQVYNNAYFNDLEPQGDTPDPNLDIISWSVEVRKP